MSKGEEGVTEKDALLINQEVQSVVQRMVDQGVYLITPRLDIKGLSYPALSNVFPEKSESEIQEFLDKLAVRAYLKSKLLDKVIVCPTCGSPSVYSKYNLPPMFLLRHWQGFYNRARTVRIYRLQGKIPEREPSHMPKMQEYRRRGRLPENWAPVSNATPAAPVLKPPE